MSYLIDAIMLFIPLASIMGLAYVVAIFMKKSISYSLSLTLSLIIGVLYFGLMFEVLEMTAMMLLFVGIVMPLVIQFRKLGNLKGFQNFSSTALLFLVIFLSSLVLVITNKPIFYWDDFTHWAILVKELVFFHSIERDLKIYYEYPPGTAVFSYFFLKFNGFFFPNAFPEGLALTSQVTLCLGFFAHPLNTIYNRSSIYALFFCLFLIIICYTVGEGFSSMMVDHILGCIFAASVCCLILRNENEDWLLPSLSGAVTLPMIKSSGLVLSFCIIFLLLLIILTRIKRKIKNYDDLFLVIKKIATIAIVLSICLIMRSFWDAFLDYKDLSYGFQENINLTEVFIGIFQPNGELSLINSAFLNAIIPTFDNFERFFKASANNPFHWPIYLSSLLTIFLLQKTSERLEDYVIVTGLYFGFVLFMTGVLILYQNSYVYEDAIKLHSFGRFVNQYAISIVLIPLCLLCKIKAVSRWIFLSSVSLVCLPYLTNPTTAVRLAEYSGITNNNRNFVDQLRYNFSALNNNKDVLISENISTVLSIWQCSDGYLSILARFDLLPINLIYLKNLGPPCGSEFTIEDKNSFVILEDIEKYYYLYIGQSNPWLGKVYSDKIIGLSNETRDKLFKKINASSYFEPVD
jgi:hypothetical protein